MGLGRDVMFEFWEGCVGLCRDVWAWVGMCEFG